MKRFFSAILISAALLGVSFTSNAQYFNHLSLGIGAGVDGASLQFGLPVGPLLQIRAGATYSPPIGLPFTVSNVHLYGNVSGDIDVKASLAFKSVNAMLDFYPGRKTIFHLTAGVYYSPSLFGDGNWATVVGTSSAIGPEDYGSGIWIGDNLVAIDNEGKLTAHIKTKNFLPYAGIGSGRSVGNKQAVTFMFDLGACYLGGEGIGTYAEGLKDGDPNQKQLVRITSADVENRDRNLLDLASSIPVMPIMKFSLFFRLF